MGTGGRTGQAVRAAAIVVLAGTATLARAPAGPITAAQAGACEPPRFKIALDVGHTVEAPGATSARGVKELEFNLRLGRELAARLKEAGFAQTHLFIMRGVGRAQLVARTARANSLGVDLLLSLHHDDVQDRHKSRWTYKGETHLYSDVFSGHALFVSRANPNDSLAFATLLGAELQSRGLHPTRHHAEAIAGERRDLINPELGVYQYDELLVLKLTKAPAVLLEAGIIVNRADELLLETPEHRARITDAALAAVSRFCGIQQAKPPARPITAKQT